MRLALVVNPVNCVGCFSCEVACKQEHNLPVGPRLLRVFPDGPRMINDRLQLRYRAEHCRHCEASPCKDNCPTGAITRRHDGVVVIDTELCTGCRNCVDACPWGSIEFDEVNTVAWKCDLCIDRVDRALKPACVAACPSHCIHYGDIDQIVSLLGEDNMPEWYKETVRT